MENPYTRKIIPLHSSIKEIPEILPLGSNLNEPDIEENETVNFLKVIFQNCEDGTLNLRFIQKANGEDFKRNEFLGINDVEEVPEILRRYKGKNQYFGVALRDSSVEEPGKKSGIYLIPGLWMEHDNLTLEKEAEIEGFLRGPSAVVQSSLPNKKQYYWLFKEPLGREGIPTIENILRRLASCFGGDLNACDASRVLRLPGTLNVKPNYPTPLLCKILELHPDRQYELDDFKDISPEEKKSYEGGGEPNGSAWKNQQERLESIMQCSFLKHCQEDSKSLSEPEWYAMIGVLAWEVGGSSLIHQLSSSYPKYSSKETNEKILQRMKTNYGPNTCEKIKGLWNCGRDCGVKSPVGLASLKNRKNKIKQEGTKNEEFTSFLILPDGKIAEEVYCDGIAKFAIWDGENVEYQDEILIDGKKYLPLVNEGITTSAVTLPTTAVDYGTLEELVEEIRSHLHRHLDISEDFEIFATWYILLTWVYDRVNTLPYLRALGDTGCGKSRFLDVIGGLCYKCCLVSGAVTPAPIYRMIRQWGGTIVLDEADFNDSSEKAEVITILNCGFEKGRTVIRCDKNNPNEIQYLPTYCPKVIATRYTFKDQALESRCLTEQMTQTSREDIPWVLNNAFYQEQQRLRNKLLMFRLRHYHLINEERRCNFDFGNIEPRLQQTTQSFAVLFANIPELMSRFKTFLEQKNTEIIEDRGESFDGKIVQTLFALHNDGKKDITSGDIAEKMKENFGFEKVSSQAVGKRLKSLKIKTKLDRANRRVGRFVLWDDKLMEKIRKRYLAPEE